MKKSPRFDGCRLTVAQSKTKPESCWWQICAMLSVWRRLVQVTWQVVSFFQEKREK